MLTMTTCELVEVSKFTKTGFVETLNWHVSTAGDPSFLLMDGSSGLQKYYTAFLQAAVPEVYDERVGTPFNFIYDARS